MFIVKHYETDGSVTVYLETILINDFSRRKFSMHI